MLMNLLPFLHQSPDQPLISATYLCTANDFADQTKANQAGNPEMVSFGAAQSSFLVYVGKHTDIPYLCLQLQNITCTGDTASLLSSTGKTGFLLFKGQAQQVLTW